MIRPSSNVDMHFKRLPITVNSFYVLPLQNIESKGQKGMVLRLQLRIFNAAGVPVSIAAWFADKRERWLKGKSKAYCTGKEEILFGYCHITPKYDETALSGIELFILYEEFQFTPGVHEILYKMTVRRCHDQKLLFQSDDWNHVKIDVDSGSHAGSR